MKLTTINIIIVILLATSTLQALGDGKCGKGCVSCINNGKYQSCQMCSGATHKLTAVMEGTCDGETGLEGCGAQYAVLGGANRCKFCLPGYGLYEKQGATNGAKNVILNEKVDFKCHKFSDINAFDGYFYLDTTTSTKIEVISHCKPGWDATTLGTPLKYVCVPHPGDNSIGMSLTIKDCLNYTSSGCSACNGTLAPTPHDANAFYFSPSNAECKKSPMNAVGTANSNNTLEWGYGYDKLYSGKWSMHCNGRLGFYVSESTIHGWNGNYGNLVHCSSSKNGNVGKGYSDLLNLASILAFVVWFVI